MRTSTAESLTAAGALPVYDVRERHARRIDAPAARALAAALAVTPTEAPLLRRLLRLRGIRADGRPVWEQLLTVGFQREGPTLLVAIGRPWTIRGGPRSVSDFAAFEEPGWAKVALDFTVEGDHLVTETRVRCTDPASRRRFRTYWLVVRPFSGLVRRSWLRAAKRRAERRPG